MTEVVTVFLLLALTAYVLFGGADFGGGILEATLPSRELKTKLQATLAPIWEANHVWLIAVVVITFVGFPRFYATALTRLYLPISLALLAILVRGTFFTLRKYDPDPHRSRALYSSLFRLSSFAAPFCFGFVLAGLLATHPGSIGHLPEELGYYRLYVAPWLDIFGIFSGLFIASLFAYAAAVFFHGESLNSKERKVVERRIYGFFASSFVLGGIVLAVGSFTGRVELTHAFHPLQITSHLVAAVSGGVLFWSIRKEKPWTMRFSVGAQILSILIGWWTAHYPYLMKTEGGSLTLQEARAPWITQVWLVIGLIAVLALVVPLLVVLFRVFDPPPIPLASAGDSERIDDPHRDGPP